MNIITIKFRPDDKLELPFAHFSILQGLVYKLLSFDSEYSEELHNRKNGNADAIKLFIFSDFIGRYSINGGRLFYRESILFEIRSADERVADIIAKRLEAKPDVEINGFACTAQKYRTLEIPLMNECCSYIMNTPITVYTTQNGFRRYYSPDEEEFYLLVKKNLIKKYGMLYNCEYEGDLEFELISTGKNAKCVTRYKDNLITAYYGKYRLTADEKMQRVAYLCGFGSKNSIGFGFANIDLSR